MPKPYLAYCGILIFLMAVANHYGFVYTGFLTTVQKADKTANRYHK